VKTNRDAIGARVTVTAGDRKWVREVKSSRGTYSSSDSRSLIFGLGDAGCGEKGIADVTLEVRWPNGELTRLEPGSFGLNRYLTIDHATGLATK
jgi:hypothetical protein